MVDMRGELEAVSAGLAGLARNDADWHHLVYSCCT